MSSSSDNVHFPKQIGIRVLKCKAWFALVLCIFAKAMIISNKYDSQLPWLCPLLREQLCSFPCRSLELCLLRGISAYDSFSLLPRMNVWHIQGMQRLPSSSPCGHWVVENRFLVGFSLSHFSCCIFVSEYQPMIECEHK